MNATSTGDAYHLPTSCIPGPRRPGSRMHTTSTKKTPQQESTPHTTTEATEDPTTPKTKRVHPTSRAEDSLMNTDMDEDDLEKEENPDFSSQAQQPKAQTPSKGWTNSGSFSRKLYQL